MDGGVFVVTKIALRGKFVRGLSGGAIDWI